MKYDYYQGYRIAALPLPKGYVLFGGLNRVRQPKPERVSETFKSGLGELLEVCADPGADPWACGSIITQFSNGGYFALLNPLAWCKTKTGEFISSSLSLHDFDGWKPMALLSNNTYINMDNVVGFIVAPAIHAALPRTGPSPAQDLRIDMRQDLGLTAHGMHDGQDILIPLFRKNGSLWQGRPHSLRGNSYFWRTLLRDKNFRAGRAAYHGHENVPVLLSEKHEAPELGFRPYAKRTTLSNKAALLLNRSVPG